MSTIERRSTPSPVGLISAPVRGQADSALRITGYAALFNVETVIAGLFREKIAPGAFRAAIRRDDVRCLFNHSSALVLGRTKAGTLRLSEDAKGLRYECIIDADSTMAMDVLRMIRRGDVSQSSFAFELQTRDDVEYSRDKGQELMLRTIKRAKLYDVSPVTYPAYEEATVSADAIAAAGRAGGSPLSRPNEIHYQRLRIAELS